MMYGSWYAGTWAWMLVIMLLFLGALVVAVLAMRIRASDRDNRPSKSAGALDVLDGRFARGDTPVDREEYAQRRRVLMEPNDRTHV